MELTEEAQVLVLKGNESFCLLAALARHQVVFNARLDSLMICVEDSIQIGKLILGIAF